MLHYPPSRSAMSVPFILYDLTEWNRRFPGAGLNIPAEAVSVWLCNVCLHLLSKQLWLF
jgi:hypothetical protein